MDNALGTLTPGGLQRFRAIERDAVNVVSDRFYETLGSIYEQYGPRGREACREDLAFHLEFLRPVLEFGLLPPFVEYLRWLASVLGTRGIADDHLPLSLEWLAEFFATRMDAVEGAIVSGALFAARTSLLDSNIPLAPHAPAPGPGAAEFETALLAGDQHEAMAIVDRCLDGGSSLVDVELHVMQVALYRIGERWQANQVTVAQEHLATAIVQSVMTMALLRSGPPVSIRKRALLACVAGNNHSIGLRMVADAFQLAGWEVQYLGANVPTSALMRQIADWKPDILGLSVSFAQQLRVVKEIVGSLVEPFRRARPAVIVGGLAVNRFERLVELAGADGYGADAESAIGCANRLVDS